MQALRARLQQSESRAVDSAPYLELEERRRRAEEGKREALRELDLAAEEVSRVRAAKAQLEDRLQVSEHSLAQMSGGGATGTTVDGEYEEWSNDSGGNGDGGGSVALIQKQRGVLISLTSKLNEKDAAALALQDQLAKAEKKIRDLEETLARKTAQLIHLQRVALERGGADDLRQEHFRGRVTMEDGVLAAFLVIQHKLDRHPRTTGPVGMWRRSAIADHVARIVHPSLSALAGTPSARSIARQLASMARSSFSTQMMLPGGIACEAATCQ